MLIGEALFRNGDLDNYLRAKIADVDNYVRQHVAKADLEKTDAEIAQRLLLAARVVPLVVDFDHPEKDVREAHVQGHDVINGRVTINGVRATRSFVFTGDADLFQLRTNPWSSGIPHGEVRGNTVIIGIEGRPDPDGLKTEIDRQEQYLREYVELSRAQIDRHNTALGRTFIEAIARRRQTLVGIEALKDRI